MNITRTFLSEDETLAFAAKLAKITPPGTLFFLKGPLGAGKTTFTRGFLRGLGYENKVKSPTYTLVEPYNINGQRLFHFDFYRLQQASELEHIGLSDYFTPDAICLIEWPEKGFPLLPNPDLDCHLDFADNGRTLDLKARSAQGEAILSALKD